MANATRVAKPRKKGKTISSWLWDKMMPPPSDIPGHFDYPAISKAREAAAKRRKMLEEMEP